MPHSLPEALLEASDRLTARLQGLSFAQPVDFVYNPLTYARSMWAAYLQRFGRQTGRALLLGMNPGPWGMCQTGVPFGEVEAVRGWMKLSGQVRPPVLQHPRVPIEGLGCWRNEVSGQRLWGWARQRYGSPDAFFGQFFVANYCPLCLLEHSGKNRTPDKLPKAERRAVEDACDDHLREVVALLQPSLVIGVGQYAQDKATAALDGMGIAIGRILHPSPASPLANKDWGGQAEAQLRALGLALPERPPQPHHGLPHHLGDHR